MLLVVGVVAVGVAGAWALLRSGTTTSSSLGPAPAPTPVPLQVQPPATTGATMPPKNDNPVGAALGVILPVATAGVKVVTALVGGGGATAGVGATAGGAGTAGATAAVGGSATVGTGAAAGGGATVGATLGGSYIAPLTAAPSLVVQGTVAGIGAAGVAGQLAPLYVVLLFVIGSLIEKQQRYAKSFASKLIELNPNARTLNYFERHLAEKWWPEHAAPLFWQEHNDVRMMRMVPSEGVVFYGRRGFTTQIPTIPPPAGSPNAALKYPDPKRIRRIAWLFLKERMQWGRAIATARQIGGVPRDPFSTYFHDLYTGQWGYTESSGPARALTGLKAFPLITGRTMQWRTDVEERLPPGEQLLSPNADWLPDDEVGLSEEDKTMAKLAAIYEALKVYRHDPNAYVYLDANGFRREYRDRVRRELGLLAAHATDAEWGGVSQDRSEKRYGFILSAERFGRRVIVDPCAFKDGDSWAWQPTT